MLNKYKFITILVAFATLKVVSQCNGCHHTLLDIFRRLTFRSGKLTKRGVSYC
jgi:hypothetical protein